MKSFFKIQWAVILLISSIALTFADDPVSEIEKDKKEFTYNGQNSEIIELNSKLFNITYKEEEYETTCTREVPYEEEVCADEILYRTECHDVPEREVCSDNPYEVCATIIERECRDETQQVCNDVQDTECTQEPYQQCRNVTRTRRECYTKPGATVCHTVPGREVCTTRTERRCRTGRNGQRVCRNVTVRDCTPGDDREVCEQQPGEEVCRDVTYRDQVCSTEYRRICRQVTRQECHDENHQRCYDVPREICHTETRRECEIVPAHQECQQIPYTERVCRMVTRYRTEEYKCKKKRKVPVKTLSHNYKAKVEFSFFNTGTEVDTEIPFFTELNAMQLTFKAKEQNNLVITGKKVIDVDNGEHESNIKSMVDIIFYDKVKFYAPASIGISDVEREKRMLSFSIGEVFYPEILKWHLKITRKKKTYIDRSLSRGEVEIVTSESGNTIFINLKKLEVKLRKKKNRYNIKIELLINPLPQQYMHQMDLEKLQSKFTGKI